jgi:small conductance mechanosensitive channel
MTRAMRRVPGGADADKHVRTGRIVRFARVVASVALVAASALLIARVWGLDLLSWLAAGPGQRLAAGAMRVGVLLVLGFAAFELVGFLVGRLLGRLVRGASDRRRTAQLKTLGPLIGSFARGVVLVLFAMMLLSEAGLKIGPLLAGAGVVGVAVGFGAQTVVKDLLTGVFLVAEDIVSVGDIVTISGSGGLVEAMTLRTIRLRDFDGTLHVFPYSEAQVIHNLTKTFSYYVFDLQISYESDVDHAIVVMRETANQLGHEPEYAEKILEPIEVVGVDNLAANGVALKARIKTRPMEQWTVGREYNRRIKLAFDREGIEIPYPHMKVVLPDQPPRSAAGGTA